MIDRFQGWPEAAQRFFIGLELDNSKSYFEANRRTFERAVRAPMLALLAELEEEFGPGKVFRLNRDLRFSRDKAPYKTNLAAGVGGHHRGGYVSLSARGLFVGSGRYQMPPSELERYRRAVADETSGRELERLVGRLKADGYDVGWEELKVVPRGYPREHPRAGLLRHRSLIVSRDYGLQPWLGSTEAKEKVAVVWRAAQPLLKWFASHAD